MSKKVSTRFLLNCCDVVAVAAGNNWNSMINCREIVTSELRSITVQINYKIIYIDCTVLVETMNLTDQLKYTESTSSEFWQLNIEDLVITNKSQN